MNTQEVWKPIPDWPLYEVSNCGNVRTTIRRNRNCNHGTIRPLKTANVGSKRQYKCFVAKDGKGNSKRFLLHRAILMAFISMPPNEKSMALHIDGNPSNNNLENLTWGSNSENQKHSAIHGTLYLSKLSIDDVKEIKSMIGKKSRKEIAEAFGITPQHVSEIKLGQNWSYIS